MKYCNYPGKWHDVILGVILSWYQYITIFVHVFYTIFYILINIKSFVFSPLLTLTKLFVSVKRSIEVLNKHILLNVYSYAHHLHLHDKEKCIKSWNIYLFLAAYAMYLCLGHQLWTSGLKQQLSPCLNVCMNSYVH